MERLLCGQLGISHSRSHRLYFPSWLPYLHNNFVDRKIFVHTSGFECVHFNVGSQMCLEHLCCPISILWLIHARVFPNRKRKTFGPLYRVD